MHCILQFNHLSLCTPHTCTYNQETIESTSNLLANALTNPICLNAIYHVLALLCQDKEVSSMASVLIKNILDDADVVNKTKTVLMDSAQSVLVNDEVCIASYTCFLCIHISLICDLLAVGMTEVHFACTSTPIYTYPHIHTLICTYIHTTIYLMTHDGTDHFAVQGICHRCHG